MAHLLRLAAHCSSNGQIHRTYLADPQVRALLSSPDDPLESPTGCERVAEINWVRKNMNGILEKDLLKVKVRSSGASLEKDLDRVRGDFSRSDLDCDDLDKHRLRWNAELGRITDGMSISAEERRILELGNVVEVNAMLEAAQRNLLDTPRAEKVLRKALKQHVEALKDAVHRSVVPAAKTNLL